MKTNSLAAKYRPQTFAQLVGQDMVKSIMSRASAEDKVAPAYLLSGTRGVGKTTIARIFAKALNCENAPTAEPCNVCAACRRITAGSFVDVVELDGASNGGVDDIRRLRETVGYAPIEGRYKVFIIDEAHMLSKGAFNALLKTLEEPPGNVTFIMATTEPHKFPITIISRCQHFVFREVPETTLLSHVQNVLTQENFAFEEEAVRVLCRRASGSVRDSMSLLGQSLAFLGEGEALTAKLVREVLGLAGEESMERLLTAIHGRDLGAVVREIEALMVQGVDMGFFLRELTTLWRNVFLLSQTDGAGLELGIPPDEVKRLTPFAKKLSPAFIHAAWQLTLDSQRRILTSLEPATGLELLLLNIASLPNLLPVEDLRMPEGMAQGSVAPPLPVGEQSLAGKPHNTPEPARTWAKPETAREQAVPEPVAKAAGTGGGESRQGKALVQPKPAHEPPKEPQKEPVKPLGKPVATSVAKPVAEKGFSEIDPPPWDDVEAGSESAPDRTPFGIEEVEDGDFFWEAEDPVVPSAPQSASAGKASRVATQMPKPAYQAGAEPGPAASLAQQGVASGSTHPLIVGARLKAELQNHPVIQTFQTLFDATLENVIPDSTIKKP